jgi:hypothetical protein
MSTFQTYTFKRSTSSQGIVPDEAERAKVHPLLTGARNTSEAVERLLERGWSTKSICQTIRYPTDTEGHKAGDPLREQHVSHIRQKWLSKKK